jgi:hypothetical protein
VFTNREQQRFQRAGALVLAVGIVTAFPDTVMVLPLWAFQSCRN